MMNVRIGIPGPEALADFTRSVCTELALNCTLVPYEPVEYGTVSEDGNVSGMVGEVYRGTFDTFQPVFTPTFARFKAIDFSSPYFYSDIVMATRAPGGVDDMYNFKVILALRWETWCVFVSALIITSAFISSFARRFLKRLADPETVQFSWFADIFDYWPALITHKHHDGYMILHFVKVVVVFWSLAVMVLSSAYTGLLFSAKVKEPFALPYKDLESFVDCLEADQCALIAQTASSSQLFALMGDKSERAERVRKALSRREILIKPIEDIPRRILQETRRNLVWIIDRSLFNFYALNKTSCDFYAIEAYKEIWSFPVRKEDPLKKILDKGAALYQENGLVAKTFTKLENSGHSCGQGSGIARRASTNKSSMLYGVVCLFGAGILGASIVLAVETLIHRYFGSLFVSCIRALS